MLVFKLKKRISEKLPRVGTKFTYHYNSSNSGPIYVVKGYDFDNKRITLNGGLHIEIDNYQEGLEDGRTRIIE